MAERKTPVAMNRTARQQHLVAGNPPLTRPEDAVANCYPGLELDVRNLDRRFFPGLVFEFIARNDVSAEFTELMRYGARVSYVDIDRDPDLDIDAGDTKAMYQACGIDPA